MHRSGMYVSSICYKDFVFSVQLKLIGVRVLMLHVLPHSKEQK